MVKALPSRRVISLLSGEATSFVVITREL